MARCKFSMLDVGSDFSPKGNCIVNSTTLFTLFTNSILFLLAIAVSSLAAIWDNLPATPNLQSPTTSTRASTNGVELWFQKYNEAGDGVPIILILSGLDYSAYSGNVISQLSKAHYVVAVDRRGHGRSTYNANDVFTFDQMAKDTYDLLVAQDILKAIWVGWSDGAATTLAGLLNGTISAAITKAFVFAGFQSYKDTNTTFTDIAICNTFVSRCASEYAILQPEASFSDFATKVRTLEAPLPDWSDAELAKIEGGKVTIAGADHDEAVNLAVPEHLASVMGGSRLKMLTGVSHFAPVQDAAQFTRAILEIL